MTLLQSGLAKSLAEDYTIDQSLRLDNAGADNDANYLVRLEDAWTSDGNQETWTISWWMKWDNEDSNSERWIYHVRGDKATSDVMGIDAILLDNEQLQYYCYTSAWSTLRCKIKTNRVFRDPSAWYHCMIVMDSTLASAADRTKFYVNGVRETSFATDTQIDQDQATNTNMNAETYVGASTSVTSTQSFGGYIAEFYRIDGQALGPDSFGETDSATNQWKPIDASGLTFGTNGFYQKYAGTELSNSFFDSGNGGRNAITTVGNEHTDTAVKKFGTASVQFDGTGDRLGVASTSLLDASAAGTMEAWVYMNSFEDGGGGVVYGIPAVFVKGDTYLNFGMDASGDVHFYIATSGGANDLESSTSLSVDTWYHLACTWNTSGRKIWIDGVERASSSTSYSSMDSAANGSDVGMGWGFGSSNKCIDGYVDEIRVSDIDRYQTDFTVATEAFTNDINTVLLLHCDGVNDGTSFPDSASHAITANGGVANTRAQRKVGDSSIYFDGTGDYLSVPDSSDWDFGTGNFTLEFWANLSSLSGSPGFISTMSSSAATGDYLIGYDYTTGWVFQEGDGESNILVGGTTSTGVWEHIAVVREGTGTDETKMYVDGTEVATATFNQTVAPAQGPVMGRWNTNVDNYYLTGYMDEIRISNIARYTEDFAPVPTTEFTADSNTMLLIHSNWDGGLGADSSGNYNTFTPTNLVATDQMVDSPTNNFCTLNAIDTYSTIALSEGNLQAVESAGTGRVSRSTFMMESGKWYWELCAVTPGTYCVAGISANDWTMDNALGYSANSYGYFSNNGDTYNDSSGLTYGAAFSDANDIIGIAFDADAGTLIFYKNNASQGTAYTGLTSGTYMPAVGVRSATAVMNFGQDSSFAGTLTAQGNQDGNSVGDFYYEPPTDYLALCTSNLSAPEIALPGEHFNTVIWSGESGGPARDITGVGFQPDLNWTKARTDTWENMLSDSVRGSENSLKSDNTAAEIVDAYGYIDTFLADGFSVEVGSSGNAGQYNGTGDDYVAWNWLAGGAPTATNVATTGVMTSGSVFQNGVSNTSFTPGSSVYPDKISANTTNGFSIVNVPTTGSALTAAHGLGQAPELIIAKSMDKVDYWPVGATLLASGWTKFLVLSGTDTPGTGASVWNDTPPTASLFTIGTQNAFNNAGENTIFYCFHSVVGYSKVGKWIGNSSADGTFVYTGFRPAYVLSKDLSSANNWAVVDDARNAYNVSNARLRPNTTAVESTNLDCYDFVSNGFKVRTTDGDFNGDGYNYLYIAFAESPFKYANAR